MDDRKQFQIIWDQSVARTQYVQAEIKPLIREVLDGLDFPDIADRLGRQEKDLYFTIGHPAGNTMSEMVDLLDHLVITISAYGGNGEGKVSFNVFPPAGKHFVWAVSHREIAGYLIGWPEYACDENGMVTEAVTDITLCDM